MNTKDLPLRITDDGSYIRIVTAQGEYIMVTTGRPEQRTLQKRRAEFLVRCANQRMMPL